MIIKLTFAFGIIELLLHDSCFLYGNGFVFALQKADFVLKKDDFCIGKNGSCIGKKVFYKAMTLFLHCKKLLFALAKVRRN